MLSFSTLSARETRLLHISLESAFFLYLLNLVIRNLICTVIDMIIVLIMLTVQTSDNIPQILFGHMLPNFQHEEASHEPPTSRWCHFSDMQCQIYFAVKPLQYQIMFKDSICIFFL